MLNKKRWIGAALLAVVVASSAFFFLACPARAPGDASEEGEPSVRIAVSIGEDDDPWMKKLYNELAVAAEDNDIELAYVDTNASTSKEQLQRTLAMLDMDIQHLVLFQIFQV